MQKMIYDTPVLIAGGGPVGLMTALELDRHGIEAILIERNPTTTQHPKMDITNGRSMELFRRWGVDKKLRAVAIPEDSPFRVLWVSRTSEWELTRFDYPTFTEYREESKRVNDGTFTLEPPMRVSQIFVEPVLKEHLETECLGIDVRFGWALESFTQDADGVTSTIHNRETGERKQIRSQYLAGCDGAGSTTRRGLGIEYHDINVLVLFAKSAGPVDLAKSVVRDMRRGNKPPDGRGYMIHFESPELDFFERFGTVWHIQAPDGSVIISQNDKDTWTVHTHLRGNIDPSTIDPKEVLFKILGQEIECTILQANPWIPRLSVAKSFGSGRVWLAGDSVRQVIPSGGYGMNTGTCDAVALGWALAAVLQGWGTPDLFDVYEIERKPVSERNRSASGRHMGVRIKIQAQYKDVIHEDSERGAQERQKIGDFIQKIGNLENEAIGIEAGYRYEESPVICYEDSTPPPFEWDKLQPSTYPGLRVPSVYLADGRPIYDLLGHGFTLIRFADVDVSAFEAAAAQRGMPFNVLDIRDDHVAKIYERTLVLVRPDQHVAWRGNAMPSDALATIDKMRGATKPNITLLKNPIPKAQRKGASKFQHLVLYVKNMAASEAFYKKLFRLNFSAANNPDTSAAQRIANQSMSFYSFGYYHHDLAFCESKDLKPQLNDMLHYTMQLKDDETIDDLIASLEQEEVAYRRGRLLQSAQTPAGYQAICLQDPDGRWVEVIGK